MTADEFSPAAHRLAIIGCGFLGRRVALTWSKAGASVVLFDNEQEKATEAAEWVQATLSHALFSHSDCVGSVHVASTLADAVQETWMVIESIPEKVGLKTQVLGKIDQLAHPMTVLATNSSSIRSSRLISQMSSTRRSRFLNTHYFRPPELRVVELMTCGQTNPEVIAMTASRMAAIGLEPVIANRESTGLIGNRIWAAIKRETLLILAEGVSTPTDIDKIYKSSVGVPQGPCELMDLVGLRTVCDIEDVYIEERANIPKNHIDFIRRNYLDTGYLGLQTGRGLLEYPLEPTSPTIGAQIVGAWSLEEWTSVDKEGQKHHPLGKNIEGMIIYTASGHVSATMQLPGQKPFGGNSARSGTEAELAEAARCFLGYAGTYVIEETASGPMVAHAVQYCSFPKYRGEIKHRWVAFEKVGGDTFLTLTCDELSSSLQGCRDTLRWRKLPE